MHCQRRSASHGLIGIGTHDGQPKNRAEPKNLIAVRALTNCALVALSTLSRRAYGIAIARHDSVNCTRLVAWRLRA
jgi:hypothetical protein